MGKPKSKYTWKEDAEKKIAQFSGATLGFIHKNMRGAKVGWDAAGKLYDWKRSRQDSGHAPTPKKKVKLIELARNAPRVSPQNNIEMAKGNVSVKAQKKLVSRSSMASKGKVVVKKVKGVRVPNKLRKQIKQVLVGQQATGTYTTVKSGFVGSIALAAAGGLAGDDLGKTQTQVYCNATTGVAPPGRTFFNQLVNYRPLALSGYTPGTGLNFFTPGKIWDAASVLFNNKPLAVNPYNDLGNLSQTFTGTTGVPGTAAPGQLKINVLNSYVQFTLKNVSNRVVTVEIWECTPTLKFQDTNPLQSMVTAVGAYSEVTSDTNFQYSVTGSLGGTSNAMFDCTLDIFDVAAKRMGLKFKWRKRAMVLAPDETCIHSIKGPKGILDTKDLYVTPPNATGTSATPVLNYTSLVKNWSVGCVISVAGDFVLPTQDSNGGRFIYTTTVGALGMPIVCEVIESYRIAVPEIAGFVTSSGLAGTSQMLNLRKPKQIVFNQTQLATNFYTVSNEVNPLAETAAGLQNQ